MRSVLRSRENDLTVILSFLHEPRVLTVCLCLHECPGCRAAYAFPLLFSRDAPNAGTKQPSSHCLQDFENICHKDHRDLHCHSRKKGAGARSHLHNFHTTRHKQCINSTHLTERSEEGGNWPAFCCSPPSQSWTSSTSLAMLTQHKLPKTHLVTTTCLKQKTKEQVPKPQNAGVHIANYDQFSPQSLIAPLSKHTQHTLSFPPHLWVTHPWQQKCSFSLWRLSSLRFYWYPVFVHLFSFPFFFDVSSEGTQTSFLKWYLTHVGYRNSSVRHDLIVQLFTSFHPWLSYKRCTSVPCSLHIWHLSFLVHSKLCNFPCVMAPSTTQCLAIALCLLVETAVQVFLMKLLTGSNLKTNLQRVFNCQKCPISVLDVSYHLLLNIARTDMSGINIVLFNHQGTHLDHIMSSYSSSWCNASSSFSFYAPCRCFEDLSFPHRIHVFIPLPFPARLSPEKPPQVHAERLDHSLPRRCFMCMRFLTRNLRSPPPDL